jgi:flagellar motor switch protein FliN/FliY
MSDTNMPRQLVPTEFDDPPGPLPEEPSAVAEGRGGPEPEPALDAVLDVPLRIRAVLGHSRMEIGELMRLRAGDIVELDRRVGEPVDLYVNNRLIARGEVVLVDNSLGVTLTEIVRPE